MVFRQLMSVGVCAFALILGSCVTNSGSVYIAGAVAVDQDGCIFDPGGDRLVETNIDPAVTGTVSVAFVVQNLVQQRNFNVATDVSTVVIDEAEIRLFDQSGAAMGSAFIVDVPGGVVPGSTDGIAPGEGIVLVPVMPAAVRAGLAGNATETTVVARITLRGRTNGDIEVEGGPFNWAMRVLPADALAVPNCLADDAVPCCNPGVSGEAYCTNVGGCFAAQ